MTTRNLLAIKSQVAPQNEFKVVDTDGNITINLGSDLVDTNVREDLASTTVGKGSTLISSKRADTNAIARSLRDIHEKHIPDIYDWNGADIGERINNALTDLSLGHTLLIPPGVYTQNTQIVINRDRIRLLGYGATITANSALGAQIRIAGSGGTRYQFVAIEGAILDGNSQANYGIQDDGSRFVNIKRMHGKNHVEGLIYNAPLTTGFSEFWSIEDCFAEDAKWFHKAVATSNAHCTDFRLHNCVMFRPSEYFAVWEDQERMVSTNCMVGSHTATWLGGILISSPGTEAGKPAVPSNHVVENFYLESDAEFGTQPTAIIVRNTDVGGRFNGGHRFNNITASPANTAGVVKLETPTVAGATRQILIQGKQQAGLHSNAYVIQSGVAYTRIEPQGADNNFLAYVSDAGANTVINGVLSQPAGSGATPSVGGVGDVIRNTSDNTLWLIDDGGTYRRIHGGDLTASTAYDPPSLATGAQTTLTLTVTGAKQGDMTLVSFDKSLQGMILSAYVSAVDTVTVVIYNNTGGTLDIASGTLRARVIRL